MRKILFTVVLLGLFLLAMAQTNKRSFLKFESLEYNFGKVKEGTEVTCEFHFTATDDCFIVFGQARDDVNGEHIFHFKTSSGRFKLKDIKGGDVLTVDQNVKIPNTVLFKRGKRGTIVVTFSSDSGGVSLVGNVSLTKITLSNRQLQESKSTFFSLTVKGEIVAKE